MEKTHRLEKIWHDLVQTFPETTRLEGATVVNCLQIPVSIFNHITDFNVSEGKADSFIQKAVEHFSSKGLPFACFRISPLIPASFVSLLEQNGFQKESEQSIMVFDGKISEKRHDFNVTVKEITEDKIDLFDRLMITGFEMPVEWKGELDKLMAHCMQRGVRSYLSYVNGQPVGTVSLFSKNQTGCVLNVSTLKEYRRRGIGTGLTMHAVSDSFKEGNSLHTLQTDKGGDAEKLYRKIGFKVDHTVSFFIKNVSKKDS